MWEPYVYIFLFTYLKYWMCILIYICINIYLCMDMCIYVFEFAYIYNIHAYTCGKVWNAFELSRNVFFLIWRKKIAIFLVNRLSALSEVLVWGSFIIPRLNFTWCYTTGQHLTFNSLLFLLFPFLCM